MLFSLQYSNLDKNNKGEPTFRSPTLPLLAYVRPALNANLNLLRN